MILVDGIVRHETKLRHKRWSHMVSTISDDELHQMAAMLGLKREWHQGASSFSHYDITPPKRAKALLLGAREVSSRALLFLNHDYANRRRVRPCERCNDLIHLGTVPAPGVEVFVPGCPKCDRSVWLAELG